MYVPNQTNCMISIGLFWWKAVLLVFVYVPNQTNNSKELSHTKPHKTSPRLLTKPHPPQPLSIPSCTKVLISIKPHIEPYRIVAQQAYETLPCLPQWKRALALVTTCAPSSNSRDHSRAKDYQDYHADADAGEDDSDEYDASIKYTSIPRNKLGFTSSVKKRGWKRTWLSCSGWSSAILEMLQLDPPPRDADQVFFMNIFRFKW